MVKVAIQRKFQELDLQDVPRRKIPGRSKTVEYKKEGRQLAVNFDSWQWFVSKANKTQFTAMLCSMTYFRRASLS